MRQARTPLQVAAGILLAGMLGLAPPSCAAEPVWRCSYRVEFLRDASGTPSAAIEAILRWEGAPDSLPVVVDVGMADDGLPGGYGAFVRNLAAFVPQGSTRPGAPYAADTSRASEGRYRLPLLPGGAAAFRYDVPLKHDPKGYGPGPDEAPYVFADGAFWTGRALFVTAARSEFELDLVAPRGERISVSFQPVSGKSGRFEVHDEERLRDSFLMVGRQAERRIRVGKTQVTLALGGPLKESMPLLADGVDQFLRAGERLFGGAPPGHILVLGNIGTPKGERQGGVFGDDVSLLVDGPLGRDNAELWKPFVCHEIFHLWNGRALTFEGQQYWFSEGMTDYYARVLLVRLNQLSGQSFLEDCRQRAERYLARAGASSLREAGDAKFDNPDLVYVGGSLAGLCLDLEIRRATANARSLDDVMKALYHDFARTNPRSISGADLLRTASDVARHPMDDFFARYIDGLEPLPISTALGAAGIRVETKEEFLPEMKSITSTLLRLPSITGGGDGLTILRSKAPPIENDDVLFEVAGTRIRSFVDLRRAFGPLVPGTEIPVRVRRGGKELALQVTLGGDAATPVTRSKLVSVDMEVAGRADPGAITIRDAVFGPGLAAAEPAR